MVGAPCGCRWESRSGRPKAPQREHVLLPSWLKPRPGQDSKLSSQVLGLTMRPPDRVAGWRRRHLHPTGLKDKMSIK